MNAAIHGAEDDGSRVELPTVDLTTIAKLEKPLSNLGCGSVNLVKEEDDGLGTGPYKPGKGP
jgi:hypothetical protein